MIAEAKRQVVRLYATREQIAIITCVARLMGIFACRRWGKTDTFINRCIKRVLEKKVEYLYISPDSGLASEQYQRLCELLEPWIVHAVSKPWYLIQLSNGSRIHLRTFEEPERLKGLRRIDEIWVDEIQDIPEEPFWRILRPMLSDVRGTLIVSGQFRGENWYYEKIYKRGQDLTQNYCRSWRFPWQSGLIYRTDGGIEELELARADLSEAQFDEMYNCVPIANSKAVFSPYDVDACFLTDQEPLERYDYERKGKYGLIIDPGGLHDPTKIMTLHDLSKTFVYARDFPLNHNDRLTAMQCVDVARAFSMPQNPCKTFIDATGGGRGGHTEEGEYDKLIEDYEKAFKQAGLPIKRKYFHRVKKPRMIQNAQLDLRDRNIHFAIGKHLNKNMQNVKKELKAFEYRVREKTRIIEYAAPVGQHDDYVSCVLIGVEVLNTGELFSTEKYTTPGSY